MFKAFVILILLGSSQYCFAQEILKRMKSPMVAAHQGGYPWESGSNSIEKFNQAIHEGADIVEMDLRLTKDEVVVVFHDEKLDEDTNCKGFLKEKNFDEIKNCKYDGKNYRIEKFDDVVKAINARAIINAEFKVQEVVVPAIEILQNNDAYSWIYFQTKGERARYLSARLADSEVPLLYKAKNNEELDWALSHDDPYLIVIEMEKNMATSENIKRVESSGKFVSVNSWRYDGVLAEFGGAACDKVFKLGIHIAVANHIKSCVRQKEHFID